MEETTTYRTWIRICGHMAERGIRTLTMHSLRHTFATRSLEAGRSVKWVSQQLGHRDASLTLNTYAHALPDEKTDLSFLPVAGAGADPRWIGASTTLHQVTIL